MSQIIEFFSGIIDAISSLLDFLYNSVLDLVYLLSLLNPVKVSIMGQLFSWLPLSIVSIFALIFSLSIILRIIGRE